MTPQPDISRDRPARPTPPAGFLGWLRRLALALAALFLGLLIYDTFAPPVSTLMLGRWLLGEKVERVAIPLGKISPYLVQAVIASEDGRFCLHSGVDWRALRVAAAQAEDGGFSGGASTIDMQTVKNLFLFPGRFLIRKALEIPLTLGLNMVWSKPRILQAYFNIAEWGDGVFGAEAAARRYFDKSANALTPRKSALLVAALPNPRKRDPRRPHAQQSRQAAKILARMIHGAASTSCVNPRL